MSVEETEYELVEEESEIVKKMSVETKILALKKLLNEQVTKEMDYRKEIKKLFRQLKNKKK